MSSPVNIHTYNSDEFVEEAANALKSQIEKLLKESELITIALSGGSSPLPVYEKLGSFNLDWNRILFFLVDERCTPNTSPKSNFGNIQKAFFKHISSDIFPMIKQEKSYQDCASDYEKLLSKKLKIVNGFPSFDLIVLGMGLDGHIASLFPNTQALEEEKASVALNQVPQLHTERITITYPVILNASSLVLLIKGEGKKEVLLKATQEKLPVSKILSKVNLILN